MRAVLYCRVSTTEQAQNLSLPTQEKACREYCARQGYEVDQVFVDAGESAKTTDRPEFRRLLEHCRRGRGKVHAVIVYSLTRFSRNSTDHHAIASLLRGLGIALRSVTEPIDDSPSGQLMEGILAAMAQFDNDVRAERVTAGMKAAAERGRWVWPAPMGYLNTARRRVGPSLEPDPARAPAIREVFTRCAAGVVGQELLAVARRLDLRTKQGHPVSLSRIYEFLRHPVYAGRVRSASWQTEEPGDFEAIVSEDLFARVQARLNNPTRAAKTARADLNHRDFPLRRFVRCATCGRGLTGSWSTGMNGTRYAFYHCLKGCERVKKAVLETAFLALMDTLRPQPAFWRLLEAAVLDVWRAAKADAGAAHTRVRRQIAALEAKRVRVDEAYLYDRTLDKASYQEHRDKLREEIALAQMTAADAAVDEIDAEGMLAFAEHTLQHASALWTTATCTKRRIALQSTMFPAGLQWQDGTFVSPVTCYEFFELSPRALEEKGLVDRPTASWKQALTWLTTIYQLKTAA